MSKIRINELARELEVKPGTIIDILPELGVHDKKTHSSSLEDDLAVRIRRRVTGEDGQGAEKRISAEDRVPAQRQLGLSANNDTAEPQVQATVQTAPRPVIQTPPAPSEVRPAVVAAVAQSPEVAKESAPKESAPAAPAPERRAAFPLRPPLASGASSAQTGVQANPIVNRAPAIPVRPVPPTPRPGQNLSGPRQPLPPQGAQSATPATTVGPPIVQPAKPAQTQASAPLSPGMARPPAPGISASTAGTSPAPALGRPAPPLATPMAPSRPSPTPGAALPPSMITIPGAPRPGSPPMARPGAPSASHPQGHSGTGGSPLRPPSSMSPNMSTNRPALAGQPGVRPVVPPRADMVARLAPRPPAPASPGQPRPGLPPARPSSPVPGRPIYTGPVRPGQPMSRGPAGPGGQSYPSSYPQRPGGPPRGRPMHPTSPLRAEPATMPTDPGRRHATKPGTRGTDRRKEDEEGRIRPVSRRQEAFQQPPVDREITIAEGITVKELSEKLGIKGNLLVKRLVEKKIFATINQTMDVKLAEDLARDFGASTNKVSYEEETTHEIQQTEVDLDREKRPPVVTIMGHVDHGKTSLLDSIREANVAGGEAGGITQHIGAYHVERNGKNIVFIDTPGHEAFTRMRARGAKVTDIVILVVAADDGVMPQTLEAIDHAKAAGVPIIVAVNKVDKPDAQPDRVKKQLSDRGLLWDEWGGDTPMVNVSAKTMEGIDNLLEMILLVADLQDLKANAARPGMGSVLEAKLDRGRGPVATVLVRNGTLKVGDFVICGSVSGKVRAMFGDGGQPVREVGPSMPAEVLGLDSLPEVGDTLQVVTDTAKAKQIVIYRQQKVREVAMGKTKRITLDQLHDQLKEGEVKELNIILKTDVGGTAEVLSDTLQRLSTDKVKIRVLHSGVGAITETDVLLASASNAVIVGFNVRPERNAQATADKEEVEIRLHSIIYELSDEIKKAMTGLLEPVFRQVYKGRAQVREAFRISKVGTVAGCQVDDGVILRSCEVRLMRDNKLVHTGKIDALKRFKNDASEVKAGFECGISLVNYNDIKPGDVIEAFVTERVAVEAIA